MKKSLRTFLVLTAVIFAAETAIMLLTGEFDTGSRLLNALFDSLLLTAVFAPLLYTLVTRQIQSVIVERESLENLGKTNSLILESLGEGIYGVGLDGNIIFMNREAEKMLGYTLADLDGKHSHEVFHYAKPDGSKYVSTD